MIRERRRRLLWTVAICAITFIAAWTMWFRTDIPLVFQKNSKPDPAKPVFVDPGSVIEQDGKLLLTAHHLPDSNQITQPQSGTNTRYNQAGADGAFVILNSTLSTGISDLNQTAHIYTSSNAPMAVIPIDRNLGEVLEIGVTPKGNSLLLKTQRLVEEDLVVGIYVISTQDAGKYLFRQEFSGKNSHVFGCNLYSENFLGVAVSTWSDDEISKATPTQCYAVNLDYGSSVSLCTLDSKDFESVIPNASINRLCIDNTVFLSQSPSVVVRLVDCQSKEQINYLCSFNYQDKKPALVEDHGTDFYVTAFSPKILISDYAQNPESPELWTLPESSDLKVPENIADFPIAFYDGSSNEVYYVAPESEGTVDLRQIGSVPQRIFRLKL